MQSPILCHIRLSESLQNCCLSVLAVTVLVGCVTTQTQVPLNRERFSEFKAIGVSGRFSPGTIYGITALDTPGVADPQEAIRRMQSANDPTDQIIHWFMHILNAPVRLESPRPGQEYQPHLWKRLYDASCAELHREAITSEKQRAFPLNSLHRLAQTNDVDAVLLIDTRSIPVLTGYSYEFPIRTKALLLDLSNGDVIWHKTIAEAPGYSTFSGTMLPRIGGITVTARQVNDSLSRQVNYIAGELAADFIKE